MVFPTHPPMAPPRLAFLLLALVLVAASTQRQTAVSAYPTVAESDWGLARYGTPKTCDSTGGLLGDCIDEDDEMGMDSEISRRILRARRRYISYGALNKNRVPCRRRGHSYYNCARGRRANPYRRGCSVITRCARHIH